MQLTPEQIEFIHDNINAKYIDEGALIKYLEKNNIVEKVVFDRCSKVPKSRDWLSRDERGFDNLAEYEPVDRLTFIRRIPFYFYVPEKGNIGRIFRIHEHSRNPEDTERFYRSLEHLHYDLHIPVEVIFEYPCTQAYTPSREKGGWDFSMIEPAPYNPRIMFPEWVEYLGMCEKLQWHDYTPRRFLTAYNRALEALDQSPRIYKPEHDSLFTMIREGRTYTCHGIFPCDEDNRPILRWTNIKVERAAAVTFSGDYSWCGELKIELTPYTRIYLKGQFGDDISYEGKPDPEEWYMVYSGPMTMAFDYEALKAARKAAKLTQKQVADAIGVSERTYQKWEYGATIPDGHNLIRIMNWLEISDVMFLTQYTDPEEDSK